MLNHTRSVGSGVAKVRKQWLNVADGDPEFFASATGEGIHRIFVWAGMPTETVCPDTRPRFLTQGTASDEHPTLCVEDVARKGEV